MALIIPIAKPSKDHSRTENYRPISLLPTLSKIFEKLILKRINTFINSNNIIPASQFGFRNNHSTIHQLLRLTDFIATNFQKSKHTLALFLDVEKAFDKVWHQGLLYKIRQYGFPQYLQQIIKSFLINRSFKVQVNLVQSSVYDITASVPQGSPLSPTLFNIFISDLPQLKHSKIALFADDTVIFTTHQNLTLGRNKLQDDLNTLTEWFQQWKIKINPTKCKAKIFSLKKNLYYKSINSK